MKKTITALVLAALTASTLSAGISYGPTIKNVLGSDDYSYGVTVQNEMLGATVVLSNSKAEGGAGAASEKAHETTTTQVAFDVNYVTDALSDNVTFVVGAGYAINNIEAKTGATKKTEGSTMALSVGTRQEVLGFQLDVTTPVVSITTQKITGLEETKTTNLFNGVNLSLTKLF